MLKITGKVLQGDVRDDRDVEPRLGVQTNTVRGTGTFLDTQGTDEFDIVIVRIRLGIKGPQFCICLVVVDDVDVYDR